jgi:hypothetical protein
MNSSIAKRIVNALGKDGLRPFAPLAYYDKHMDCVRVELRDCSFTEERLNEHVTFLEDNYPAPGRSAVAGIMFKGVKHLFTKAGLPLEGVIHVTTILNQFVKNYPELVEERIWKIVNEMDLTVDMSEEPDSLVAA